MPQEVERYRRPTRILHWVHTGAFVALFLTGLILFLPAPVSFLAVGSWTRFIHRIAAAVFIVAPAIYIPMNWKATLQGIKEAFSWGADDMAWLQAAPRYYFLGDEKSMPPQPHMNAGQKLWWFMVLVFGVLFVITGIIMWAFKTAAPTELILWSIFVHDIAFIATGAMLFVHIYLGVFHPLMAGAWGSMARGKVSVEYAKAHHGKWYEKEIAKGKEVGK
jgi:formate dehydrogenase subunit gamma